MITKKDFNIKQHWIYYVPGNTYTHGTYQAKFNTPCISINDEEFGNGEVIHLSDLKIDAIKHHTYNRYLLKFSDCPSWLINKISTDYYFDRLFKE